MERWKCEVRKTKTQRNAKRRKEERENRGKIYKNEGPKKKRGRGRG